MKKHIPNIITIFNLISGCIAIVMAFQARFEAVLFWIIVAAIFDFLDGLAARALRVQSLLGKELDSLADVVSFGVAPSMAVYILLADNVFLSHFVAGAFIPYLAFLIPAFSAYRLAKFNIDERQTETFIGLPTPANGLFWASYCAGINSLIPAHLVFSITLLLIPTLSLLMISNIPMLSFKIKKLAFRGNEPQIVLIILTITFIALWGIIGIALSVLTYILLSIFTKK